MTFYLYLFFLIWLGFDFLGPKSICFIFKNKCIDVIYIGFRERKFELKKKVLGNICQFLIFWKYFLYIAF